MNQEEREARDRQLQGELKLAFEEYLLAMGTEKIEAKQRYLEKLGRFGAIVMNPDRPATSIKKLGNGHGTHIRS